MRAAYLLLALMGTAAVDAANMEAAISGGDVLARSQALLLSSSASASASSYSKLAGSDLPSDITAALAANSLQWAQLPDLARVGLLWVHGYVVSDASNSVSVVKVYTSCGAPASGSSSVSTSEDARGIAMDQIALSLSAFTSTQCLHNTCGVYHQSTNTNCDSALSSQLLCAVEQISGISVPTATGSFWSDAGDGSTETPFPQLYSHTVPVSATVTNGVPSNVTLASIHLTTKGAHASPSCSTSGDTVIPCLQLTGASTTGSHAFCRPQIDAARLQTFLTAAKTQLQKSSSSEATPISNSASDGSSSSSGLSTGAILGIAGGALVVLGILAFYFLRRKKTQGDAYHADRDVGGGFGRKSVGPPGSGNGNVGRPDYPRSVNGNGNVPPPGAKPGYGRTDTTPIMNNREENNESEISPTDYYKANGNSDNGDAPRPRTTSRPQYLAKNTSGSSSGGGSSRGAMYSKTVEEYSEESETICEFLTDPQILMRRIPYEELTPLRLLSKGSYGEVFLAQLETRHVATKRLLPEKKMLTRSIEQFTAEIQLMCQLEHRNIVSFVGVSWDYLQNLSAVVEYMDNGDLAEVLARSKGRFTWQKEKISISMDVAEGLVYLHSMRPVVVHRDLKSKNVLLNKRGQAKLSDFGVSRKTTVNETMTSGVGTLLWTAPEIIEGRKYSEKADIFSLGVVLSEIDTCDMPYAGVTDEYGDRLPGMQIVQMVRLGELKVSLELDCPPRLRELVLQCTSLDPDLRPTSMEVAYTLKSIIAPSLRV